MISIAQLERAPFAAERVVGRCRAQPLDLGDGGAQLELCICLLAYARACDRASISFRWLVRPCSPVGQLAGLLAGRLVGVQLAGEFAHSARELRVGPWREYA